MPSTAKKGFQRGLRWMLVDRDSWMLPNGISTTERRKARGFGKNQSFRADHATEASLAGQPTKRNRANDVSKTALQRWKAPPKGEASCPTPSHCMAASVGDGS